ncbi:MAG: fumarylacetoacetate hydrolase family protein, partial [Alphaproteobacteria bacterium]|nr:fumarylacetoacetate hydrolase family protein [Alphaproteobacteria bacterium]
RRAAALAAALSTAALASALAAAARRAAASAARSAARVAATRAAALATSLSAAAIAAWVLGQHENGQRYQPLPADLRPADLATAYQVQARLATAWAPHRGPVAGYKIAVTSKAIQELCKMESPCAGRLFADEIKTGPAALSLGDYTRLGLEFELAVRVGQDLAPGHGPWDVDNVRDHVATVAAAFEMVDDRNADYDHLDGLSLVADNSWAAGVVLGPECAEWRDLDLTATPVALTHNGITDQAVTGAAMGNPLASLAWVANLLNAEGGQVKAGEIVITGSTLATRFPAAGDQLEYMVDGVGEVALTITA